MEPHQCSFIIPLVRTFIEGTSHKPCATWLEPQTNGKNIKESRIQFLGNRTYFIIFLSKCSKLASTCKYHAFDIYWHSLNCNGTFFSFGNSFSLENSRLPLLEIALFHTVNTFKTDMISQSLVFGAHTTKLSSNIFKYPTSTSSFSMTPTSDWAAVCNSKYTSHHYRSYEMLKCGFLVLCGHCSNCRICRLPFSWAGSQTKLALQENLCPRMRNAAALINATCCKTTSAP